MPLTEGTRLGTYEVLSPLGAGGMGGVPSAGHEAPSRGRDQALPEAKLLAGLNHPSIATLYGLESIDDQQMLIMELVEGETLAERIARGPVPLDEAIPLFAQIAEGLGAAHDKGVVHRDLKPANVKIAPDGNVKILDFGLAKAFDQEEAPGEDTSQSPTLTKGTAMGVILGTAPYMSPEQARGKSVDKRTDIWSFGCCLFEALTGTKAFDGATVTDTLAAVVKSEPEWSRVPAEAGGGVELLLRRCLEKDAHRRPYDARDLRLLMEREPEHATPKALRSVWPMAIAAALVGGIVVWGLVGPGAPYTPPTSRLEIYLDDHVLEPGLSMGPPIALSPDGSMLVYSARVDGPPRLYLRRLDEFEARAILNTDGGIHPFFSADGQWIGFEHFGSRSTVNKISVSGGGRLELAEVLSTPRGGSWTQDGRVLFAGAGAGSGIRSVSDDGGESETLTVVGRDEAHAWPEALPDGSGLLFTLGTEGKSRIAVLSFETGNWRILDALGEGGGARYLPTGHLVYVQNGTLLAVPFDPSRLDVVGPPTPVLKGIVSPTNSSLERPLYTVSTAGHLAYVPGASTIQRRLVWVDRAGRETPLPTELGPFEYPSLSPQAKRLAYSKHDAGHSTWVYDFARGIETRLTQVSSTSNVWAPDGRSLALSMTNEGVYRQDADGRTAAELLVEGDAAPGSWSPDGTALVYTTWGRDGDGGGDLWAKPLDGEPQALIESPFEEYQPQLSPDGRWLAYVSTESGNEEVYVQPYPALNRRWLVSRGGGREPRWSPLGSELFYRHGRGVFVVGFTTRPEFQASAPELLFEGDYHTSTSSTEPDYDIGADGRFLMIRKEEPYRKIHIVLNWFSELERLVPIP